MVILTILVVSAISRGTSDVIVLIWPVDSLWSAPERLVACPCPVRFAHVGSANADTGELLYSGCSTVSGEDESLCVGPRTVPDADYTPCVSDGFLSLVGDSHRVPVKILRDTEFRFHKRRSDYRVRPSLPVDGIDLILGNHLGHDSVFPFQSPPPPVVRPTGVELSIESDKCFEEFPEVFTACAVTRLWLVHR